MTAQAVLVHECPACGSAARTPVLGDGSGCFDLARCDRCGLVHSLGHHPPMLLDAGYGLRAATHDGVDRRRKQRSIALYDRLTEGAIAGPSAGARALDLGCNTGLLLDELQALGWRTEGVERAPGAREFAAAKHVIHDLDLEDDDARVHERGDGFDLVTITHVLEHMKRPVTVARFIARHLTADGLAVVEVPNWDDAARGLWGKRYRPLELGDHVCFFDRDSLRAVLEQGGLRVRTLWSQPQGATTVMASLLTAVDAVRALAPRRRTASVGATAARCDRAERAPGGLRASVLRGLDALDPMLDRVAGPDARWGANLVAIAQRA